MVVKVAVLGARGNVGSAVVRELSSRGKYEVYAVARNGASIPKDLPHVKPVSGDASKPAELEHDIKGIDVLVSALHHDIPAHTIVEIAKKAGAKRLIVVGGAASLHVSEGGIRLYDKPTFPDAYKPQAKAAIDFFDDLKKENFDWTFFSPPPDLGAGTRTGKYRLGTDVVVYNEKGESAISFDDYGVALVDEIENNKFSKARFTAAY